MKTTVQKSALITALLLLTACAGGPGGSSISLGIGGFGSHIGLGTSVNIPIGSRTPAADTGGINVTGEQIITHFAADGTASEQAVKGSSYHRLLNVLGGGNYLVQDFYGDGQKRTDPMILPKKPCSPPMRTPQTAHTRFTTATAIRYADRFTATTGLSATDRDTGQTSRKAV